MKLIYIYIFFFSVTVGLVCSVVLILASSSLTKLGTRTPMFQATLGSFPTYSQLRTPNSTPVEDCYNYMLLVQHLPFWCFPNLCRLDVTQVIRLLKEHASLFRRALVNLDSEIIILELLIYEEQIVATTLSLSVLVLFSFFYIVLISICLHLLF